MSALEWATPKPTSRCPGAICPKGRTIQDTRPSPSEWLFCNLSPLTTLRTEYKLYTAILKINVCFNRKQLNG